MAAILFIAPTDLGETVLATGALAHVIGEGDQLSVFCDPAARDLFRAAPGLREVQSPAPGETFGAWANLARRRFTRPYDLLLDLRGTPAALAIAAKRRLVRKTPLALRHFVEDASELVGAERVLAPKLWLDDAARKTAAGIAPEPGPLLVLAPGGVTANKRWPAERFAAVARRLASGPLQNAHVLVVGAAARDAEITHAIVSSLAADGVLAGDVGQGPDLLADAALMERATLVIGNDNALTHIAAAMGAPTLTLFGPTDERVRAPYGPRTRTLRGRGFEEIAARPALDAGDAMDDVSIDSVEAAAVELLHAGGLR